MVHSLGLTIYNLRPRKGEQGPQERPLRPEGRVLWMHAPIMSALPGLLALATKLIEDDGWSVLLTCPESVKPIKGMILQPPPEDSSSSIRLFLEHWRPDAALFSDGELRPAALHEAGERRIPLILADGRTPYLLREREGWFPGLVKSSLQAFDRIVTIDENAARQFRKAGATLSSVAPLGRMEEDSAVLPCLEAERVALAKLLATRPVWLAVGLPQAEEEAVIAAHRATLSLAHRLLLIIVPESADSGDKLAERLTEQEGWVVARRAIDEEPDPDVEVFITDGMTELGLWYRLAPITFMGGSLAGKGCLRNPMEPAALGSAILYGPRPGAFGTSFGRLGSGRAARAVGNARDLAEALADLTSPDKVARLAQAAWNIASEGAEVTDHIRKTLHQLVERHR